MTNIPQHISLPDQVVTVIRDGIAAGRWTAELPSERILGKELQVSRMTLRKALAQLARERWIKPGGRGRAHGIRRRAAASPSPRGRTVRLLTPYSWMNMGSAAGTLIEGLNERLGAAGYCVEIERRPAVFDRHRPNELRRLDSQPDTAGWILFFATEAMQRWFAACGRPCIVFGRTYEGVQLSSIFADLEAVARHGAGLLVWRGHRDLVYLIADFTSLNDRLASAAFVQEARRLGASARVVTHPADMPALRPVLDDILSGRPRPTGIFSSCPEHCLTILCHLQNAGLRVPGDAAIICGWDDLCLHYSIPTIAHYCQEDAKAGRKAAALLLDQFKHGPGKIRTVRIMPEFVSGGTLG